VSVAQRDSISISAKSCEGLRPPCASAAGYNTELTFPHWLAKATYEGDML